MGPEESPFFRFPSNPTARSCAGFKRRGGLRSSTCARPTFGRRLSLHVQSPPPIALNIQFAARAKPADKNAAPLTNTAGSSLFRSFPQKACWDQFSRIARTASGPCFDTASQQAKQKASRGFCAGLPDAVGVLIRTENILLCPVAPAHSFLMAFVRQKVQMIFSRVAQLEQAPTSSTRGIVRSSRELSSKRQKYFFAVIASIGAGCKIHMPAS